MVTAVRGSDGSFRVPFTRAWRVNQFTTVIDPETGERLIPDRRRMGLLHGILSALAGPIVVGNGLIWMYPLDQRYGAFMVIFTLLLLASILVASSLLTSIYVTFSTAPDRGPPRRAEASAS